MRSVLLLTVALALAGCTTDTGTSPTATSPGITTPVGTTPAATMTTTPVGTTPVSTTPVTTTPTGPTPTNETPSLSISKRIVMGDFRFEPSDLVVAVGSEVRFDNEHVVTHTATSDTGYFDSGRLEPGERFEVQMNQTGKFSFYCKLHPQMRGNITVIEVAEEPTPTPTSPTPVEDESTPEVRIFDYDFRPGELTIEAGQTVVWTNTGTRQHTVTANDGSFDSGRLDSSGTFSHTFTTPGTYAYKCSVHPGLMSGTVTVT